MKFKFLISIFLLSSCTSQLTTFNLKTPYSSKGFAYIYNEYDYSEKIISGSCVNLYTRW